MSVSKAREVKRLGQYFSGDRVATLLAELSLARYARSVIDPMAGTGDMLVAARSAGAKEATLLGVEIDEVVARICSDRLEDMVSGPASVHTGNAFAQSTWHNIEDRPWDLVITNPPYVRYQAAAAGDQGRVLIPSAKEVRSGLIDVVENFQFLSSSDRRLFKLLGSGYSGLADLAVPSWLLCAALVGTGGRLAMVVPDTWLSRKYASPILYMLLRLFEIEMIVEDTQAVWFKDVLVRPNLIVARRVKDRRSAFDGSLPGYLRVRLDGRAMTDGSLVGRLFVGSTRPEKKFADHIWQLHTENRGVEEDSGCSVSWMTTDGIKEILTAEHGARWMKACEPRSGRLQAHNGWSGPTVYVPPAVRHVVSARPIGWQSLSDCGWSVGQGLRTGANRFFYGEKLDEDPQTVLFQADRDITVDPLPIDTRMVRPCIRRQRDLSSGFEVPTDTKGLLLLLQAFALSEDIENIERVLGTRLYEPIPEPLASHIRRAAVTNIGKGQQQRPISGLTAVCTNVRPIDPGRPERRPRFWYQLPELTGRHVPALLIPRVNHGNPRTIHNRDQLIIDANFVALWPDGTDSISAVAMLAILNSTYVSVVLEDSATILGGGALKTEASDLRRLPLPSFDQGDVNRLERLGADLAASDASCVSRVRELIDGVVGNSIFGSHGDSIVHGIRRLKGLNEALHSKRVRSAAHRSVG